MAKDRKTFDPALHEALRTREVAFLESHGALGQDAMLNAIADDRKERWAALRQARTELGPIVQWAERMAAKHGLTVQVWRTAGLDWLTALYIVRYGEAESHWPPQLTLDDLTRALQWERGQGWPAYVVVEAE